MPLLPNLVVRDDNSKTGFTPSTMALLIALVILFAATAFLVAILLFLRQIRRNRMERSQDTLPMYSKTHSTRSSRLTISTSNYGHYEKEALIHGCSTPPGDVPEIRITFPEEVDESGKKTSGRVVVVKVGDYSVGLEPVDEQLPPYDGRSGDRFQSLDMERIGGLKEKDFS